MIYEVKTYRDVILYQYFANNRCILVITTHRDKKPYRQTDRQTDLGIKAPSWRLKKYVIISLTAICN